MVNLKTEVDTATPYYSKDTLFRQSLNLNVYC